jgi:predicted GIY-YIG superfamily endonuclease
MTESIVSIKNRIPIATKDFWLFPKDCQETVDSYQHNYGLTPHNAFINTIFSADILDEQISQFPIGCIVGTDYDYGGRKRLLDEQGYIGFVNRQDFDESDPRCNDMTHSQGIYFCLRQVASAYYELGDFLDEIVYIGKTINIQQRFSQHHKKDAFDFLDVYKVLFISYNPDFYSESDLLWAERQYIDMLKPILNDRHCSGLLSGNAEESKSSAIQELSAIWDQGYAEGLRHGFASAKNSMMEFFDSVVQPPKLK